MEKKYILKISIGNWREIIIPFSGLSMAQSTAESMTAALEESEFEGRWSVSISYDFWEGEERDKVLINAVGGNNDLL